jgi:hypothetical protein
MAGKAAKKTGFGRMRMDEIGLEPPQQLPDFPESPGIGRRRYLPLQVRQDIDRNSLLSARFGEKTFLSRGDGHVKLRPHGRSQTEDVSLRSATFCASDDIQNSRFAVVVDWHAGLFVVVV